MTRRVVIVGASLAGASTATTLRELGFDGTIDVIGAEEQLPYERPALSKTFLAGKGSSDDLLVNSAAEYDAFSIRMHLGSAAVGIDTGRRLVNLADCSTLEYDDLVIATGSVNRRPGIAGMDLAGVHQLRTLADADALRAYAAAAHSAVIVGQGFIGCEVAATLRSTGLNVTMVDPQPGPLYGPLGPEVSSHIAGWHRDNGVRLLNEVGVAELIPSVRAPARGDHLGRRTARPGHARTRTSSGRRLRRLSRRSGPTSTTAACSTPALTTATATSSSAVTSASPTHRWWRSSCAPAPSPPS